MIIKKYTSLLLLLSLIGQTLAMENDRQSDDRSDDQVEYMLSQVLSRLFLTDEIPPIEQLYNAISFSDLEKAEELLEQKVDPNTQNFMGFTPLHIAAMTGNLNSCKLLIKYGANPSLPSFPSLNSELPLHGVLAPVLPIDKNRDDIAIYFIEDCKVDPNTKCASQDTFLHQTAVTGNVKILKRLLRKGAHPNATNTYNSNALHSAAFPWNGKTDERSMQCIIELLRCGVDYKAENKEDKTPAQYATSELVQKALKDDSSVKKLLISGTDLHEKNLYIAVMERGISGKQMRHKKFNFERTKTLFLGNK